MAHEASHHILERKVLQACCDMIDMVKPKSESMELTEDEHETIRNGRIFGKPKKEK